VTESKVTFLDSVTLASLRDITSSVSITLIERGEKVSIGQLRVIDADKWADKSEDSDGGSDEGDDTQ
jgi:hypothetical protein